MASSLALAVAGVSTLAGDQRSAIGHLGAQAQPPPPIIVKVITPPRDPTGIADVIIGSIGLTGAIVLLAIVLGLIMAAILFWFRSKNPLGH